MLNVSGATAPRLVDRASGRLRALCVGAGLSAEADAVVATFAELVATWGHERVDPSSPWRSEISDDHTPVEFSAAIAGQRTEVRALFEPQADEPTVRARRDAGLALHERLRRDYDADLARFKLLEELFLPDDMDGPFALWSSVVFTRGAAPAFKAYFNPQARGRQNAPALVDEALRRLGMPRAMAALRASSLRRGPELDELKYFALDLSAAPSARVKVYVRHHGATPQDLEAATARARRRTPGEALGFARAMRGGDGPLAVRAAASCSAFTAEVGDGGPDATAVYVPVCAYAHDDGVASERLRAYMLSRSVDPSAYDRMLGAFANRPLWSGVGMQSWFSVRTADGAPRFAVYLATELRRVFQPGTVPAPSTACDPSPEFEHAESP